MTTEIQEFHISPWVLPKEDIMGWIKWSTKESIQEITISTSSDVTFYELFNVVEPISPTEQEIRIDTRRLEIDGFVGFLARYLLKPQTELDIEFHINLVDNSKRTISDTKTTRIVRPMILVNASDSIKVKEDEKSSPQFRCQLINASSAEALDVEPKFNITSIPFRAIEVITENASSILESAPIRLLRL